MKCDAKSTNFVLIEFYFLNSGKIIYYETPTRN